MMDSLSAVDVAVRVMLDRIEAKTRGETVDKCKALIKERFKMEPVGSDGHFHREQLLAAMDEIKKPTLQELIKKWHEEVRPMIEAAERSDHITAADLNVTVR